MIAGASGSVDFFERCSGLRSGGPANRATELRLRVSDLALDKFAQIAKPFFGT